MTAASVCIPTFYTPERGKDLENLLHSLTNQTFKDFEVIIIDGKNYEETKKIAEKQTKTLKIRVLKQKSRGLANARNEAWINSDSEIIVFIDDDVRVTPLWLEEIVKTYRISNAVGGVGGFSLMPNDFLLSRDITKYLLNPDSFFKKVIRTLYFKLFLKNGPFEVNKIFKSGAYSIGSMTSELVNKIKHPQKVDFLDACNMSFKREVLKKVGGFDNAYVGLGDYHELDLCFRVRKAGYKLIFNPKAIVYHFPKKTGSGAESIKAFERQRNFARFVKRNLGFSLDFLFYSLFLSGYYFYKSISENDMRFMKGISGFTKGFFENEFRAQNIL